MASKDLTFRLIGKDVSAGRTFDKVGKQSDGLGKKLGRLGGVAAKGLGGLALGAAAAGAAAIGMAPRLLSAAGALEQTAAKALTVFGPQQIKAVDAWAAANAHAMGLTKSEAKGLAAGFGDLLVPMGFTREQAAKMSTDTVGLAGALSQWSGGTISAADAADRLSAAMLGETDGLKSLGIAISAADVEARLAEKGQKALTGAARQQAEALAIQALIFEKSTDAQNAYKSSGGTLLGQQAKLTAQFKELRDKGIAALAPHLLRLTQGVTRMIEGFKNGTGAGGRLREMAETARAKFEKWRPVLVIVGETLRKIGGFILTEVVPAVWKMQSALFGMAAKVIPPILNLFGAIINGAAKAFGWVPGLGGKLDKAAAEFNTFKDSVNAALAAIRDEEVRIKLVGDIDKRIGTGVLSRSEAAVATRTALNGNRPAPIQLTPPARVSGGRRHGDQVNVRVDNRVTLDGRNVAESVQRRTQVQKNNGRRVP